jgi:hypothetical protein
MSLSLVENSDVDEILKQEILVNLEHDQEEESKGWMTRFSNMYDLRPLPYLILANSRFS